MKPERIDALSGRLRSGLRSGAAFSLSTKTDSEMAAPFQLGPPHAPATPEHGDESANGSAAIDSTSHGDQAPTLT